MTLRGHTDPVLWFGLLASGDRRVGTNARSCNEVQAHFTLRGSVCTEACVLGKPQQCAAPCLLAPPLPGPRLGVYSRRHSAAMIAVRPLRLVRRYSQLAVSGRQHGSPGTDSLLPNTPSPGAQSGLRCCASSLAHTEKCNTGGKLRRTAQGGGPRSAESASGRNVCVRVQHDRSPYLCGNCW